MAGEVVLEGGVEEEEPVVEVEVDTEVDEGAVAGEVTTPLLLVEGSAPGLVLLTALRSSACFELEATLRQKGDYS